MRLLHEYQSNSLIKLLQFLCFYSDRSKKNDFLVTFFRTQTMPAIVISGRYSKNCKDFSKKFFVEENY
jgi:hypothetical protein